MSEHGYLRGSLVTGLHVEELPRIPDPLALLDRLRAGSCPWLLDSALQGPSGARFSFAGADPYAVVRGRGGETRIDVLRTARADLPEGSSRHLGDPLERVRSLLPPAPAITSGAARCPVPFLGGAVGYWGYELGARIHPLDPSGEDDMGLPDLALLLVDALVAIDHLEARAWVIGLGFQGADASDERAAPGGAERAASRARERCRALAERVSSVPALQRARTASTPSASTLLAPNPAGLESGFDAESYAAAVCEIGEEIAAGNVYQANLSQRMELRLGDVDPGRLYRELRELNPSPFAAYLELPEVVVLSSSPERFLRLDPDGRVESRPIKGTRRRGATADEDRRLEEELRASEKDRAENLMIVDLVRNDLGRVCCTGSVEVPELMAVEPYATVHQMVSTVQGRLREDRDAIDLLRACFPPGSMTGAPKLAAMRIIDRLEPVRRGVYAGALGYLDVRGGLDLSVVIRTLLVAEGRACLHVGGAVVADSDPQAEWQESLDKARALLAALCRVRVASSEERAASSGG